MRHADPTASRVVAALEAAVNRDPEELLDAAADLAEWLRRGGVPPRDPRRVR
jgi:hypothetical protein